MISICIPTYNQRGKGAQMLTQLLKSIARQKGVTYEVCISDNDTTGEIKKVVDQFPGITYKHNPVQGASENINAALDMACYDKVKLMMQDDMFYADNALQLFSEALDKHAWVISDSVHINEAGGRTGKRIAVYDPTNFDNNTVGMPSVIGFRKNDIRFYEKLKTFCDLYFYYQLYQLYGMPGKVPGFNIAARFHNASQSRNQPPSHDIDKNILISEGRIPVKRPKVVVAVVVYDRIDNIERWINVWDQCNTNNEKLVIIHNTDTEGYQLTDHYNAMVIGRKNIGFDIGAFQDVCRNRLPGFPDYDYLLWCTDDTIPMDKNFIQPFIDVISRPRVGMSCMHMSNEYARHVRTTGFCISKQTAQKIKFPWDPVVSIAQCRHFEHRGKNVTLLAQVEAMRLRVLQVAPLEKSPLYDMNYPYRNEQAKKTAHLLDRMNEHNKIFNTDAIQRTY